MYKISVIMPIFNVEEYLENTLKSVINQTIGFENIELILVDDCSTDNSREIIEKYSNDYPNIKKIFLEKNTGCPGIPRNIGIRNATSDYIMFIDHDDEYFPEICDKLYNTIISEDADIVVCDKIETKNNNVLYHQFFFLNYHYYNYKIILLMNYYYLFENILLCLNFYNINKINLDFQLSDNFSLYILKLHINYDYLFRKNFHMHF